MIEELEEVFQRLGEIRHHMWVEKRREQGWHPPEECPNKRWTKDCGAGSFLITFEGKHCSDCYPCMRSYSERPNEEKELDRQCSIIFLKLLSEKGFAICRKEVMLDAMGEELSNYEKLNQEERR